MAGMIVPTVENMAEIDARIRKVFRVLERITNGVVAGNIHSLTVSGAAGCGKTYTLERILKYAAEMGKIKYTNIGGVMSPVNLYMKLYETSDVGGVLLLDDIDSIFGDIEALNMLKRALDTKPVRTVHYAKESLVLAAAGIPNEFDHKGSVVFITNIDMDREVARDSKMAKHYAALMSRSLYVDMGIHTKREILVRVSQVVYSEDFLREQQLGKKDATEMMKWISTNVDNVRFLSIRSVVHLASLLRTDGEWQEVAEITMFKRKLY